jgi:hypothetical protein
MGPFPSPIRKGKGAPVLGPDFFSKLHSTFLEIEGLVFNVLLFLHFCRKEIKALWRFITRQSVRKVNKPTMRTDRLSA